MKKPGRPGRHEQGVAPRARRSPQRHDRAPSAIREAGRSAQRGCRAQRGIGCRRAGRRDAPRHGQHDQRELGGLAEAQVAVGRERRDRHDDERDQQDPQAPRRAAQQEHAPADGERQSRKNMSTPSFCTRDGAALGDLERVVDAPDPPEPGGQHDRQAPGVVARVAHAVRSASAWCSASFCRGAPGCRAATSRRAGPRSRSPRSSRRRPRVPEFVAISTGWSNTIQLRMVQGASTTTKATSATTAAAHAPRAGRRRRGQHQRQQQQRLAARERGQAGHARRARRRGRRSGASSSR